MGKTNNLELVDNHHTSSKNLINENPNIFGQVISLLTMQIATENWKFTALVQPTEKLTKL
jgi:hypothetical protein